MEWLDGLGWALSSSKAKWEEFLGSESYKIRLERFDLEALGSCLGGEQQTFKCESLGP